jgi:hypothetical protein
MVIVLVVGDKAWLLVGGPQIGTASVIDHLQCLTRSANVDGTIVLRILIIIDDDGSGLPSFAIGDLDRPLHVCTVINVQGLVHQWDPVDSSSGRGNACEKCLHHDGMRAD